SGSAVFLEEKVRAREVRTAVASVAVRLFHGVLCRGWSCEMRLLGEAIGVAEVLGLQIVAAKRVLACDEGGFEGVAQRVADGAAVVHVLLSTRLARSAAI